MPELDDIRLEVSGKCSIEYWYSWMLDSDVKCDIVVNCRDPQGSMRTLRALGACREHGEAGETSNCCCMYLSVFTIVF